MGLRTRMRLIARARANAALDRAEDPREVMDYAWLQQQELLRRVRQGLVEVATSRQQLANQGTQIRERIARMDDQAGRALDAGRDDLARLALSRKQAALGQLSDLERQLGEVAGDEQRLMTAEQGLATRVADFRYHRQVVSARYTAAEAQVRVAESLAGVSGDLAELTMAVGRAEEKTERMRARATAIDALIDGGSLHGLLLEADDVERELRRLTAERAVEEELSALRAARASAGDAPAGV